MRSLAPTLALLAACSAPPTLDPAVPAAPGAPLIPGVRGPHGAARTSWRAPARVTERIVVEVTVPVGADGALLPGPHPAVVLLPGGLVAAERYRWIAEHAATRGYVVVAPHAPADLALFAPGNARAALDAARAEAAADGPLAGALDPDVAAAVIGHSLGGVTAAQAWYADPDDFSALGMIAAYPTGNVRPDRRDPEPVLSIVGSTDERADAAKILDGFERFPSPRLHAVIAGLNHYDWADDVSEAELRRDGPRERPVDVARTDGMRVFDTWLDAALRDDPIARVAFDGDDFGANVEVTR
jgi:dienelactone hydrolase